MASPRPITEPSEALEQLHLAVEKAGYSEVVVYGLDSAASHFYDAEPRRVRARGQGPARRERLISSTRASLENWGVVSFEDPLDEDDFEGFAELTRRLEAQIIGDDLLVTNRDRVARAQSLGAANSLLFKVNQAGTLSEAFDAARQALQGGWSVVVSERSGETEDPLISTSSSPSTPARSRQALLYAASARQVQPAFADRRGAGIGRRLCRAVVPASLLSRRVPPGPARYVFEPRAPCRPWRDAS